ncbi:retrovirus-related pol polyprotein from transposon TNT 1-94 [Tanacetum coccineum]|uniref:Retrovirus-related pol polyprotein from transposon TNT 1-94 n=1 Tax=Tanacetum coccineum TaxID=301880 RepID=A0ABQ4ZIJ9_9ASTR
MQDRKKCLKLETELLNKKDFIEKETYDKLDNSVSNQSAPSFYQYFELNELKAWSQEKDTVIKKLKERIISLSENMNEDKIKKDIEEIETINIELDHRKLKGKALVDNVVTKHTIDPEMLKIDVELITPKLLNKRTAHFCNACMVSANHDLYVLDFINNVNARAKSKSVKKSSKRKVWKPTGKVFTNIRYSWRPTGRTFTIVGNACPLTRITTTAKVPLRKPTALEFAFRQHACFIRNLEGVDLLTGSRGNNLYTLSLGYMMVSSPICLLSKASNTKSWLWHRRLSHLNFGIINHLVRHGLVRGLPKLKFEKDHLCSACAMGKSKKKPHKSKSEDTNQEKLYLLHMDLCGPMRVASVNGKKYILVIVDDYSRYTWVKFLRSKDEALDFIIKFLKMIQMRLQVTVQRIRRDNGTEFVNQTLREYYEKTGISHETSVARSPQQNGVVERRNRALIEATSTMLIYAKAPLFLWTEAVATACYTQNSSIQGCQTREFIRKIVRSYVST